MTCSNAARALLCCLLVGVGAVGCQGAHGGFGHATTPDVRLDAVSFELPSGDCVSHDAAVNQPVVTAATAVAQAVFVRTTQAQPDERRFNLAVRFAVDPVAQ